MKSVHVLLAATAAAVSLATTACTTTSNRRDLFAPNRPHGPYSQKLRNATLAGRQDHRTRTHHYLVERQVGNTPAPPAPAGATPAAPPPPPPPPPAAGADASASSAAPLP